MAGARFTRFQPHRNLSSPDYDSILPLPLFPSMGTYRDPRMIKARDKKSKPRTKRRAAKTADSHAHALWGGRFAAGPDGADAADQRLDRRRSPALCPGHRRFAGPLPACWWRPASSRRQDGAAILAGLDRIEREIEDGTFAFSVALEDIHMNIEARLAKLIGDAAGRLHTARSRNDQVALDLRLWVRDAIDRSRQPARAAARADRPRPKRTSTRSCPASPICRWPSRLPSATI